ncbi:HAD family hydrolase [Bacillus sp. Marseille-P3661]|uniref:HAD family hydrolase n=1 Tax=Bacillus sp. Marseille-P3661 TaxID=1936234 RepID=UPI000C8413DA|nr:HAD family hydrolase [Bacillus sp. Marseille-P3661]
MRAFASDLDRTLIYSSHMIDTYGTNEGYELIETYNGKEVSYISTATKIALMKLTDELLFIPVTTRTAEQYRRISLFHNEIIPQYAITSNGATILKQGMIIKEWTDFIHEELHKCMPIIDMIKKIESLSSADWLEQIRDAEQLFIYLIIKRNKLPNNELVSIKKWAHDHGWQTSLQGRKLYFIPHPINKWNAVEYLCQQLKIEEVYGAGDSLLDYDLIRNSTYGVSPAHGEVLQYDSSVQRTKSFGMGASNDIIELVLNRAFMKF